MATEYNIHVKANNGEDCRDTVTGHIKGEVAHLASLPDFELGEKISTKRSKSYDGDLITTHTYEGGTITVRRYLNQLTYNQRVGNRKY